ncbi:MAG: response regulator [Planctomycetota bacterium]|nr:MAG: response regulator [Planctomycetota bacterium]
MLSLVVEDDFVCRKALSAQLARFGDCDIASDGVEALQAVDLALADGRPYDLICLDIQMPNLDGQATLKALRLREQAAGYPIGKGAKVLMTTSMSDKDNIFGAFRGNADGYLTKPITTEGLAQALGQLGLVPGQESLG